MLKIDGENNIADILTKNVTAVVLEKHVAAMRFNTKDTVQQGSQRSSEKQNQCSQQLAGSVARQKQPRHKKQQRQQQQQQQRRHVALEKNHFSEEHEAFLAESAASRAESATAAGGRIRIQQNSAASTAMSAAEVCTQQVQQLTQWVAKLPKEVADNPSNSSTVNSRTRRSSHGKELRIERFGWKWVRQLE